MARSGHTQTSSVPISRWLWETMRARPRDAAEALFAESLDLARRVGMRAIIGYALIALALTGQGGTDPGWSARLHGAAGQALADLGLTLEPLEARLARLDRQRLRAALGAEAFDAGHAAGRTLGLAQMLAGARTPRPSSRGTLPHRAQPLRY